MLQQNITIIELHKTIATETEEQEIIYSIFDHFPFLIQ